MGTSKDLFALIQSLSRTEKRYFRLRAEQKGKDKEQKGKDKNYIRLFDELNKQTKYDRAKLEQKFKGETFLKSLHVTEKYLYDAILESLREYELKNDIEGELAGLLFNVRILERKGLYEQCKRVLKSVYKKAKQYDRKKILLEVLQLKIKLTIMLALKKRQEEIEELYEELSATMKALVVEQEMSQARDMIFMLARQRGMLTKENERKYIDEWAAPLLNSGPPDDFFGATAYFDALGLYYRFLNDGERCFSNWEKLKKMWDAHPHICKAYPTKYRIYINNYLTGANVAENYEAMLEGLNQLSNLSKNNYDEEAEQFWIAQQYGILYALNAPDYERGLTIVEKFENEGDKYLKKIIKDRELILYSNISLLFFLNKDYNRALEYNYKIIADPKNEQAEGVRRLSLMMQLPIHYELNNYDTLADLVVSVKRKLHRNDELFELETAVLSFFKQLVACVPGEERQIFREFKDSLSVKQSQSVLGEVLALWLG